MSRLEHVVSHRDPHIFITAFADAGERVGWDVLVSIRAPGSEPLWRVPVSLSRQGTAQDAVSEALDAACRYIDQGNGSATPGRA